MCAERAGGTEVGFAGTRGGIYMLMDGEDVLLKAGDTVVQRGTNHTWSNRGTETCLLAFVLVDGVARLEEGAAD